jgi:hypothetical protein
VFPQVEVNVEDAGEALWLLKVPTPVADLWATAGKRADDSGSTGAKGANAVWERTSSKEGF